MNREKKSAVSLRFDSFSFDFNDLRSGGLRPYAAIYPDKTSEEERVYPQKASGMENVRFLFRDRLLRATVSGRKLSGEQSILISFDKA